MLWCDLAYALDNVMNHVWLSPRKYGDDTASARRLTTLQLAAWISHHGWIWAPNSLGTPSMHSYYVPFPVLRLYPSIFAYFMSCSSLLSLYLWVCCWPVRSIWIRRWCVFFFSISCNDMPVLVSLIAKCFIADYVQLLICDWNNVTIKIGSILLHE